MHDVVEQWGGGVVRVVEHHDRRIIRPGCMCKNCYHQNYGPPRGNKGIVLYVPPVKTRPTWLEIVERDSEILTWNIRKDALLTRQRRMLKVWELLLLVSLLTFVAGLLLWAVLGVFLLALFAGVVNFPVFCAAIGAADRIGRVTDVIGKPPSPIVLDKYAQAENAQLLTEQVDVGAFQALCPCPSCGYVYAHDLLEGRAVPGGMSVLRRCEFCNREWGQK